MAFDNSTRLVSALVRGEDMTPCLERGMKTEWLPAGDDRDVYAFVVDHYGKYGSTPSAATVLDHFPGYTLIATTDPLDYFIDQLVKYNRREKVLSAAGDAVRLLEDGDHEAAATVFAETMDSLGEFSPLPVYHTDLTATVADRYEELLARKSKGSAMLGLESGYPSIDNATLGFQPEQLIVLVAPSKTGKSTVAMQVCINMHEEYGITPLFISFEMSRRELGHRHDAVRAKVPLSQFLNGTLPASGLRNVADMMDDLEKKPPFVMADSTSGVSISAVQSKIKEVKPDFVVIDGMYLMEDESGEPKGSPQALTNLTRGLKRLAQVTELPIFITTQALRSKMSKGRVGADSAGYSSSFSQDADVLLGLEEVEDNEVVRTLRVVMSRNCGPTETTIDFNYDLGEFGEI